MKRSEAHHVRRVRTNLRKLHITPHDETHPVYAYVNHGRWVANCHCLGGAELVTEGEEFLCGNCGSVRPVVWPADIEQIEAALARRPTVNQNWQPGETVQLLAAENLVRGI